MARSIKQFGGVDALLNNAGIASMNHALLTPASTVNRILQTNVLGTFLFCREMAKLMRRSEAPRIVEFHYRRPPEPRRRSHLYASKAAVESLTRILARELAELRITVNAIGPTPIDTDLIRGVPQDKMDALIARQPIQRLGTNDDVRNAIDFFLRPQSDFITAKSSTSAASIKRELIQQRLESFGERIALIEAGCSTDYREFLQRIGQFKAILDDARLTRPAVIAIQCEHLSDQLAALLAIAEQNHIAQPLARELTDAEQHAQLSIAHTQWRLSATSIEPLHAQPAHPLTQQLSGANAAGLILFSSGTSGEPKGMLHNLHRLLEPYSRLRPRQDRTLQLLLADHIGGLDCAFRTLFAGSTLVVPAARTPQRSRRSDRRAPGHPTARLTHLFESHAAGSGAATARPQQPANHRLRRRSDAAAPARPTGPAAFPGVDLQQKFGTSETGAIRIRSTATTELGFTITDHATEWKVVDGELWLKTPARILGYLNADQSALEADGWYRTGDLVETAADGSLRILGRSSDCINIGGQKVHPSEIETVLLELEDIQACTVSARPDPLTGNALTAPSPLRHRTTRLPGSAASGATAAAGWPLGRFPPPCPLRIN